MKKRKPDEETEIVRMYQAGATARALASQFGRSKSGVLVVLRRAGIEPRPAPPPPRPKGSAHPRWKGGRWLDSDGYVVIWTPDGWRREHRVIAGAAEGEVVHHRDRNKANNNPANLEVLRSHAEHMRIHAQEGADYNFKPGEQHRFAKLSASDVREIRRLRGVESQRSLALRFGVNNGHISDIQTGKKWANLT